MSIELNVNIISLIDEIYNYESKESKRWNTYSYNGKYVPRVSDILKNMLYDEFLLGWANSLGYKRQSYTKVRDLSARKGTASHNLIEEFLKTGIRKTDFSDIESDIKLAVYNCYNSFLSWYDMISSMNSIKILDIEKELVCPYVGGTLDCLVEIDEKTYIMDLKTSNHMTYKYFIQLGAYMWILKEYYGIVVDGVFILWLDKEQIRYNDYLLRCEVPEEMNMINHSINSFLSLLYAYYNRFALVDMYNNQFDTLV